MRYANEIDLGLAVLACVRAPGECLGQRMIAEVCGVTQSAIYLIERKALKKLRNRLRFLKDPRLVELVESRGIGK